MIIPLVDYAKQHGRRADVARHMAKRGGFKTAYKLGRDWVLDEDEPWPDRRVTTGKYRDKYAKIRSEYAARKAAEKENGEG